MLYLKRYSCLLDFEVPVTRLYETPNFAPFPNFRQIDQSKMVTQISV